ncbi:MAG: hypothetical protein ABIO94_12565 [Opitutaceae bacterium]
MKPLHLLLTASVAANAALIALFVAGTTTAKNLPARAGKVDVSSTPSTSKNSGETNSPTAAPGPETWAFLSTGDLPTQLARLREQGFSPSLTRSILAAQIRTNVAPRRNELEMQYQRSPYFRPKALDAEAFAELRALTREEDRAIRALLGPDVDSPSAQAARNALPGVAPERIAQIADIFANYEQMRQDIGSIARGQVPIYERERIIGLEIAMRAELAAVLTSQELEDYDLRTSNVANSLRNTLAGLEVSEPEFRALHKLLSVTDQTLRSLSGPVTPDEARARNDARKQMLDEMATVLGPDRYAAYLRSSDYSYRQTAQLVTRLELPLDTANQIYAMQQDLQNRANSLQNNRALDSEDRNAQLATLSEEARARVGAVLGAEGYEAYKEYGGTWLQMLQPRPGPPRLPGQGGL